MIIAIIGWPLGIDLIKGKVMFYSASYSGFYSQEIHGKDIPKDAKEITQERYIELLAGQSEGKNISHNNEGYPILLEQPKPDKNQLIDLAKKDKDNLLQWANNELQPLNDAYELGSILPKEVERRINLMKFRVAISRIDVSLAPDIEWPQKPE